MFPTTVCLFTTLLGCVIAHLHIIPERAEVTYINPKYLVYGRVFVKRFSRKSPYYLNLEGTTKQTWTNNITLNIIFFEKLNNEYKRTFVEMHLVLCDMLNSDPYVGQMFKSKGIVCPLLPGEYLINNMTVPTDTFPHVWPFQKGRLEMDFSLTSTKEAVGKAYLQASFVTDKKKKH